MKRSDAVLAVLVTAVSLPPLATQAADPAPVVAAERAFAADGLALGVKQSFLKHSTPDAILFAPEPVKAHDLYGARPDKPGPALVWWPVWAGLAESGDLGFTSGPATYDGKPSGWYFTVWKRQADGGWKWVYDGGAPSDTSGAPGPDAAPAALAAASGAAQRREEAWAGVVAAETELARAASQDLVAAYGAALAPDARVQGSSAAPAVDPAAVRAELAARAPRMEFSARGGEASQAGDLAWTWGDASWSHEAQAARGHYVRIWRHDREGWRLVFDQILPVPPSNP
ncbi:MAG: nuclear transport factor 2 family protein [Phenylobacterium sp.]|uniref:nuclear transport factor 2 family protein n=1 Tax=Phenylobacterium sp. TaxID=1871053 RepID=UPI00391BCBC2